jgi:ubiquinone/menaquinone biosynthesis C-methylase UbiE
MTGDRPRPEREVLEYYGRGEERDRLEDGYGPLERERTREILSRVLPRPPATIADIGGGAGVHALWLASSGYSVHLRDPVPLHVEQAGAASREQHLRLASVGVGDAREVDLGANSVDVVLLLGPLYHLQEAAERQKALGEARRILRVGGLLAVAAISRWAPVLDGLKLGLLEDRGHLGVLDAAGKTGRFDPLPQSGFTRAYFHRPGELREEAASAGFKILDVVGVEGPGFLLSDFGERWADPRKRAALLEGARRIERVPELLGLSPHLLLTARL